MSPRRKPWPVQVCCYTASEAFSHNDMRADPPESTGAAKATASGSSTPSGAASPSHTSKSSNVGPIAGGVVGGKFGLFIRTRTTFDHQMNRRCWPGPSCDSGSHIPHPSPPPVTYGTICSIWWIHPWTYPTFPLSADVSTFGGCESPN